MEKESLELEYESFETKTDSESRSDDLPADLPADGGPEEVATNAGIFNGNKTGELAETKEQAMLDLPRKSEQEILGDSGRRRGERGDSVSEIETKAQETRDGAAKDGAPKDGAPKDGAPKGGAPKDGAQKDGAPKDGTLMGGAEEEEEEEEERGKEPTNEEGFVGVSLAGKAIYAPPRVKRTTSTAGDAEDDDGATNADDDDQMPSWKKAIVERKRAEALEQQEKQEKQKEKWNEIPEWKKKILERKSSKDKNSDEVKQEEPKPEKSATIICPDSGDESPNNRARFWGVVLKKSQVAQKAQKDEEQEE